MSDCIIPLQKPQKDGYRYQQRSGIKKACHRWAYEDHIGGIPEGMIVCHKCDVRGCVNPDHLFLGTNADNQLDKKLKGRACRGITRHNSVLTEQDVREIRRSSESQRVLGRKYGVHRKTIRMVQKGKTWMHVSP